MTRLQLPTLLVFLFAPALFAQTSGVQGDWRTPEGAVLHVGSCGADLCATLIQLEPNVPSRLDSNNPDPSKRTQALCGLRIGYGFHATDANHAEEGRLYDPKSGKTYRGTMTSSGNQLLLRGYVGMKAFGRTETWTRTTVGVPPCK